MAWQVAKSGGVCDAMCRMLGFLLVPKQVLRERHGGVNVIIVFLSLSVQNVRPWRMNGESNVASQLFFSYVYLAEVMMLGKAL